MAMSGAVIPSRFQFIKLDVMDWTLEIPESDPKQGLHRKKMVITDGGHSDNLGLLALMERHVPRIIVTDIAFDPKDTRGDLAVITQHAEKLLGMKIDKVQEIWANNEIETDTYSYSSLEHPNDIIGTIIYIKPLYYKQENGFQDYLLTPKASHLRTYLDIDLDQHHFQFPTDKTFAYTYEYYLIFSYYMLGRYFATNILEPELVYRNWHEKITEGCVCSDTSLGALTSTFAGALPSTFTGELPCADCEAIEYHLDLFAEQYFFLRRNYKGKQGGPIDDIGRWTLSPNRRTVTLQGGSEAPVRFALAGHGAALRLLRPDGKPIESSLNYTLRRAPQFTPIEPLVSLEGRIAQRLSMEGSRMVPKPGEELGSNLYP
jgi:hypothetical protein